MLTRLVNIVGSVIQPPRAQPVKKVVSNNPFANPFISNNNGTHSHPGFYGKNKPVMGGYFTGYYNGKPNIVGQRLFIEV